MRQIATFEALVDLVHKMSANYHDETVPVRDMEFFDLEHLQVAGERVEVLLSAQRLFANRLRVPHSYLARCPLELQAENLNYWLGEEVKTRESLFCRFDGKKLRAVFTDRYTAIDHMEVLSLMLQHGFEPETEVHFTLDEAILVMKVPDFARGFDFGAGDKIIPGISVANSEVGILALSIEAYFFRIVCSNGMISKTSVASRYKHISRRVLGEFPDILHQVVSESDRNQGRFAISKETRVENPLGTIGSFNRQFQLDQKEGQAVRSAWEAEQGFTMFHVINAYTRGAQDTTLTAEESYRLERTGGLILSLVKG